MRLDRFPILALTALLLFASAFVQAAPTHLRGHVTSHLTGQPLELVDVTIYAADGTYVPGGFVIVDPSGDYVWSGNCPDVGDTCTAKFHANQFANGHPYEDLQSTFANGAADAVIDFVPHALGSISAALTGPNGVPTLSTAGLSTTMALVVFVFDPSAQTWQRLDSLQGTYYGLGVMTARFLPEGRYRVCAGGIDLGLQRQCFDHRRAADTWAKQQYTDVTLGEGEQRTLQFNLIAGGSISGELVDTYKHQPLSTDAPEKKVRVALYDSDGALFDRGTTNFAADSNFHVSGTPKGLFRIVTGMLDPAYRDAYVLFPGIPCPNDVCQLALGTQIQTDVAGNVGGIDLALHPTVVIRGRVTDVDTHLPVADALVSDTWYIDPVFNEAPPIPITHNTRSDADGNYSVYGPAAQPLYLRASGATYQATCSAESTCVGQATSADTQPGDIYTIDIALKLGGSFSGTLRDVPTQYSGAMLSIYDSDGRQIYAVGDAQASFLSIDGAYRSPALPPGTYYAIADLSDEQNTWRRGACQVYAAHPCPPSAGSQVLLDAAPTPIVITAGADRSGVDFTIVYDGLFTDGFDRQF